MNKATSWLPASDHILVKMRLMPDSHCLYNLPTQSPFKFKCLIDADAISIQISFVMLAYHGSRVTDGILHYLTALGHQVLDFVAPIV